MINLGEGSDDDENEARAILRRVASPGAQQQAFDVCLETAK
jgi:hypothetical protein